MKFVADSLLNKHMEEKEIYKKIFSDIFKITSKDQFVFTE